MATGKVRIFELAKEVGLSSKDLIALFNDRLGGIFEARNQLSIVPDQIADLVRSVLAKPAPAPAPKTTPTPPPTKAPPATAKPAPPKKSVPSAPTLKPVAPSSRRSTPSRPAAPAPQQEMPAAETPAAPAATTRRAPAVSEQPIPTLRPVPAGQSTVAPRPQPSQQAGVVQNAPGMQSRPGLSPRPGQPGLPGQGYQPRTGVPGRPPQTGRRPAGNGPFRPLGPPRPLRPAGPVIPDQSAPAPSSGGGRPGDRVRVREDKISKKDREKDLLLEKERARKKRSDGAPVAPARQLETIEIPDLLTVQELATSMIVPAKDVITELIKTGTMATINQNIPSDVAISVARKFGFNAVVKEAGEEVTVEQEEDKAEMMTARPPVVTVLGHVDHGKTSLLDKIREANVAEGEAGGITQKIGAYTVERSDRKITFIDTPGHEAFTAMRARGAKVADVAVLVVAADDGVMPQTKEAIAHARAAEMPIVVAINKMDKAEAQPERVKQQLAQDGLQPVDWGGKTETVPVSARTGDGIDQLLETVLLEADIQELRANKNRRATGIVIESALDRGRGAVATVLVQNGTLRVGDIVVVGGTFGKIRALVDDKGKQVKKAGP
ncbi:MAG: translation initiation factor IF-2, partial [Candidatus Eremiobacteraeota bacterium]|nr:translation initiation factor IF-2 [Candidatus Eremiobacteraeota bacterium]